MEIIEGGVTAAKGFKAAGMAAGIKYKNGKKDMAMVFSEKPCVTAGTFTLNRVFAAPVTAVLPMPAQVQRVMKPAHLKQRQQEKYLEYQLSQYF